jgi:hypothetical protein
VDRCPRPTHACERAGHTGEGRREEARKQGSKQASARTSMPLSSVLISKVLFNPESTAVICRVGCAGCGGVVVMSRAIIHGAHTIGSGRYVSARGAEPMFVIARRLLALSCNGMQARRHAGTQARTRLVSRKGRTSYLRLREL